ncbi:MAG: hypothetical protein HKN45_07245 [Flavobacteriales bacterium]|nr:hypothetical protein [Flavobacteriales bacterium]
MATSTLKKFQTLKVKGCVAEFKAIKYLMHRPEQLARVLGFKPSYLNGGYAILQSQEIPKRDGFKIAAYTNVPTHDFDKKFPNSAKYDVIPMVMKKFKRLGPYGLAKVIPLTRRATTSEDFPPGTGVAQWILTREIAMKVIAVYEGKAT